MNWNEVTTAAPELAAKVQRRFEAHGLGIMATLRRDGSPRVSGIETFFGAGELWLGMMPGSVKAKDLLRDARFALHSATVDKDVTEGDAKISGRAVHVEDDSTFATYARAAGQQSARRGEFHLFRVHVREMSHLVPAGDHLDIQSWSETAGLRQRERR